MILDLCIVDISWEDNDDPGSVYSMYDPGSVTNRDPLGEHV
jgi:hypothetical protein